MGLDSGKKFLELLNSNVSPVICVSSDFKTIAGRLRYFASARLLSMLIAISGVGGGARQDAYARPMDACACTASKFAMRTFQHGPAIARLPNPFECAPPTL